MELTEQQIQENWNNFKYELGRKGSSSMFKLIKHLEEQHFDRMPASSSGKYHGGYPGGLVVHCLTMLKLHRQLKTRLGAGYGDIELCILLHDVGKLKGYKKHCENSIEIVSQFIMLGFDQENAIRYHMGMYGAKKRSADDIADYSLTEGYTALEHKFTKYLYLLDDLSSNYFEE